MTRFLLAVFFVLSIVDDVGATPYPDPSQVPGDDRYPPRVELPEIPSPQRSRGQAEAGFECLRVAVRVDLAREKYTLSRIVKEKSATAALIKRAPRRSKYGSYVGILRDLKTKSALAHDSIGTGREYRRLVDEITFRFPLPKAAVAFELIAENPRTGKMETVYTKTLDPARAQRPDADTRGLEIREIMRPQGSGQAVRVNIYAEGYLAERAEQFWQDAGKTARAMLTNRFPGVQHMHFFAVFKPSRERLGSAEELGAPRASRDTFLGLFFPYWEKFGRWYNVVYPAEEEKFRAALALAPYDYAIAIADDGNYWGIGNFRVMTAVPAHNWAFTYLLLHEAGHYFGLNEEYEEEGATELEFAPGIHEPWSPNITFLRDADLKWRRHVRPQTEVPTPSGSWQQSPPVYGAYRGGYAGSEPRNQSHKPGLNCVMDRGSDFCAVCHEAIAGIVDFDRAE